MMAGASHGEPYANAVGSDRQHRVDGRNLPGSATAGIVAGTG